VTRKTAKGTLEVKMAAKPEDANAGDPSIEAVVPEHERTPSAFQRPVDELVYTLQGGNRGL
jgi:hypothetical protein